MALSLNPKTLNLQFERRRTPNKGTQQEEYVGWPQANPYSSKALRKLFLGVQKTGQKFAREREGFSAEEPAPTAKKPKTPSCYLGFLEFEAREQTHNI